MDWNSSWAGVRAAIVAVWDGELGEVWPCRRGVAAAFRSYQSPKRSFEAPSLF